jgi:hypothetical protein
MLILLYPPLIVYIGITTNMGVYTWLFVLTMLTPFIATWYITVKKRIINYLRLLTENKPFNWNIDKTLKEYMQLIEKDKD